MKPSFFSFVILFIFAISLLFIKINVFKTSQEDLKVLNELQRTSLGEVDDATFLDVKQVRFGVYKEIWQTEGLDRKMIKISSPSSKVVVKDEEGHLKLIEELKDCKCQIQEKILRNASSINQEFQDIKASQASFCYDNHSFILENLTIQKWKAPGATLPLKEKGGILLMKGQAKKATFKLQDQNFSFLLDRCKATFYTENEAQ